MSDTKKSASRIEKEIERILDAHEFRDFYAATSGGQRYGEGCWCWRFKGDRTAHRAHVASILADVFNGSTL